jgi:hypothetical protein
MCSDAEAGRPVPTARHTREGHRESNHPCNCATITAHPLQWLSRSLRFTFRPLHLFTIVWVSFSQRKRFEFATTPDFGMLVCVVGICASAPCAVVGDFHRPKIRSALSHDLSHPEAYTVTKCTDNDSEHDVLSLTPSVSRAGRVASALHDNENDTVYSVYSHSILLVLCHNYTCLHTLGGQRTAPMIIGGGCT